MDEAQKVPTGYCSKCSLYQEHYGSNRGDRSVVYKRGDEVFFLVDSWFSSKKVSEAVMEVGSKLICMVKTNTKGFCKENIDNLTKELSGGSYLVLRSKPMIPGGRP